MKKISIIIPVHNGERYLCECLDSILAQTLDDIEVLCIDDASTDATKSILAEYQEKDRRIETVYCQENRGAGASRNLGLDMAKGKYVIFLDADDVFEADMLQKIYYRAENYDADICVFREDQFYDDISDPMRYSYSSFISEYLEKQGVFSPDKIKDILFNLWNGWAWDKLFRREFIIGNEIRFQEIWSSEDGFFVHAALAVSKKITFLNKVYVHHRVDINSSVSNSRDSSWECCYSYLHELMNYLVDKKVFLNYKKSFINWAADFLYWNYWSLNETNRIKLFLSLKQYMLKELGLLCCNQNEFYYDFYYWFIREIDKSDTYVQCKVPANRTERWMAMFRHSAKKIDGVFQYLKEHQYNAAVWGAGIRSEIFIKEYGENDELKKVYDNDDKKEGKYMVKGYRVEMFNLETCEDIDFIIVTNTCYADSISKKVKAIMPRIKVLDLEEYMLPARSLPLSLSDCIL